MNKKTSVHDYEVFIVYSSTFIVVTLSWCKQDGLRFLLHQLGQLLHRSVRHASCLAVFHTGRRDSLFCSLCTQVAQIRRKRNIVDGNLVKGLQDNFVDLDPPLSDRVVVLLLAGHLAGMASGAVFVINQQSMSSHLSYLAFSIFFTLQRVVL
jgi:hypothetical protein